MRPIYKSYPCNGRSRPAHATEKKHPGMPVSVSRGAGYYKVPSLQGVWYRSMFGHSGWSATLEDWFDPQRERDDDVPTGFKPHDAKTYPVKGHRFGLGLPADQRREFIAFLTL
jgi:hypothetical protein